MKKIMKNFLLLIFISVFVCSCGGDRDKESNYSSKPNNYGYYSLSEYEEDVVDSVEMLKAPMEAKGVSFKSAGSSNGSMISSNVENLNVKLIFRANLTVQTLDYTDSYKQLNELIDYYGGYFESIYQYNGGMNSSGHPYGNYSIRIPSEKYSDFINRISSESHVVDISQSVEDVSLTYSDIEKRLETLNTKHERLISLLSSASKMEDIIDLENALSDCESEIDRYSSRKRNYDSLIGFSTISLNLIEVERLQTPVPEKPLGFGAKIVNGLKSGFNNALNFIESVIIWIASNVIGILIFFLIVAVVIILILKFRKKFLIKKYKFSFKNLDDSEMGDKR